MKVSKMVTPYCRAQYTLSHTRASVSAVFVADTSTWIVHTQMDTTVF